MLFKIRIYEKTNKKSWWWDGMGTSEFIQNFNFNGEKKNKNKDGS